MYSIDFGSLAVRSFQIRFLLPRGLCFILYPTKSDDNMNKLCKRHFMYLWIAYLVVVVVVVVIIIVVLYCYLLACLIYPSNHALVKPCIVCSLTIC